MGLVVISAKWSGGIRDGRMNLVVPSLARKPLRGNRKSTRIV